MGTAIKYKKDEEEEENTTQQCSNVMSFRPNEMIGVDVDEDEDEEGVRKRRKNLHMVGVGGQHRLRGKAEVRAISQTYHLKLIIVNKNI